MGETLRKGRLEMKMILEQASNSARCDIVDITSVEQILEIAETGCNFRQPGVVITKKSLLSQSHDDPDIKWHITIYDGYIE